MKINKIILIVLIAFVFMFGCGKVETEKIETTPQTTEVILNDIRDNTKNTPKPQQEEEITVSKEMTLSEEAIASEEETTASEKETASKKEYDTSLTDIPHEKSECILSVNCQQILGNIDKLKKTKVDIIPEDGIIYGEKAVEFTEGESVFDVLLREMKQNNIHIEFEKVPMYNSAYIEGIGNIYEFDCGTYSGWMYSVNGVTPKIGCSQYIVKNGDKIEFFYSCNTLP